MLISTLSTHFIPNVEFRWNNMYREGRIYTGVINRAGLALVDAYNVNTTWNMQYFRLMNAHIFVHQTITTSVDMGMAAFSLQIRVFEGIRKVKDWFIVKHQLIFYVLLTAQ